MWSSLAWFSWHMAVAPGRGKKANWQRKGRPIWAAEEWQDIATWAEELHVEVCHVDAHDPKSWGNEEH